MKWLSRETVVVPVDFSEDALAALAAAREMVKTPTHLRVIHVLPLLEVTDPGIIWDAIDDESRRIHAEKALREEIKKIETGDAIHVEIRFGDPGHEIVAYAEQEDAGLIVVSSHGQSGLRRLLLGSVAERVVRLAHCPVLVLKKKP